MLKRTHCVGTDISQSYANPIHGLKSPLTKKEMQILT